MSRAPSSAEIDARFGGAACASLLRSILIRLHVRAQIRAVTEGGRAKQWRAFLSPDHAALFRDAEAAGLDFNRWRAKADAKRAEAGGGAR